jgi:hypothetical protein
MEALDDDEFGERTATFQPVLNNIRVKKLPISASSVRQHLIENDEDGETAGSLTISGLKNFLPWFRLFASSSNSKTSIHLMESN